MLQPWEAGCTFFNPLSIITVVVPGLKACVSIETLLKKPTPHLKLYDLTISYTVDIKAIISGLRSIVVNR